MNEQNVVARAPTLLSLCIKLNPHVSGMATKPTDAHPRFPLSCCRKWNIYVSVLLLDGEQTSPASFLCVETWKIANNLTSISRGRQRANRNSDGGGRKDDRSVCPLIKVHRRVKKLGNLTKWYLNSRRKRETFSARQQDKPCNRNASYKARLKL